MVPVVVIRISDDMAVSDRSPAQANVNAKTGELLGTAFVVA